MVNALTIDVEEYFHPTEVQSVVEKNRWATLPSYVGPQTRWILDVLDQYKTKGTFFVLGWIARHHPALIRTIAAAGHEIGCHGYAHQLAYRQTPKEFKQDLTDAIKAIEDACFVRPRLFRAPSYSITTSSLWALDILAEFGFTHDSSIYPIEHDRYGIPSFHRFAKVIQTASGPIQEVPIATARVLRKKVTPVGGGGYLRLLPYAYTAAGIRAINRDEGHSACIYIHPWELDPNAPRIATGTIARLRTYTGLGGMRKKFLRLLQAFHFSTLTETYPAPAPSDVAGEHTGDPRS